MTEKNKRQITEENIDRELELLMDEIPEQEDFEKKIDRYISRKIKKITVKTIVTMGIVGFILFLMISPAMNKVYMNPKKLNQDHTLENVLRDYYELTRPYVEIGNIRVDAKGFSRYELGVQAVDTTKTKVYGLENVTMNVQLGKYKNMYDPERILTTVVGRFERNYTNEDIQKLVKELEKLPESAVIRLEILDKEVRNVKELQKENIELDWVEVYHPNHPEFQGGLSLWKSMRNDKSDDRENMTEQELLNVYCDNLKNLVDYPEIWSHLQLPYHSLVWASGVDQIKETYEDAKTLEKLQTKSYYISGSRDEILEYLKKTEIESFFVNEVKSNQWD